MNVSYFLRKFRSILWKKKKKRICKEKSDFFLFISFFSFFVYKRKNKIFVKKCRDSFFSPIPHGGWDLGPAGPIQWICREWAKRLGLSGRTIVSHGVPNDRTEVNYAYPRRPSPWHGLGGSGSWTWSQPSFWTTSSSFYTIFFPSLERPRVRSDL